MRYCVQGRQPYSVINKADEVYVQYNDRDKILDMVEKCPNKTVILDVPIWNSTTPEWKTWQMYSEKFENFYLAIYNIVIVPEITRNGIKWYYANPIKNLYDLHTVLNYKPSFVFIGAPLSFSLHVVKTMCDDVPVRIVPNLAKDLALPNVPTRDRIVGPWVRPEDVEKYEEYVTTLQFEEVTLKEEETLLHVYKDNKKWPGDLGILFKGLDLSVANTSLLDKAGQLRMTCGQGCLAGKPCHVCDKAFLLTNKVRDKVKTNKKIES